MDFDQRWIIWASILVPVLYIAFEWEFTYFILWILAGWAMVTFNDKFVEKSKIKKTKAYDLGLDQQFAPRKEFGYDYNTKQPLPPGYQSPPYYNQQHYPDFPTQPPQK